MDTYREYCRTLSIPEWVASLLYTASRHKSDRVRRKKAYKLIQSKLFCHKVGCSENVQIRPTYVFPPELKQLVRTVFPQDIRDYPDPSHEKVVVVTLEDLNAVPVK